MNQPVKIKYGKKWWQFWKPWKTETLTLLEMQKAINEGTLACLTKL